MNASSRVATFNLAFASSRPPPSSTDRLVTASSGARQKPPARHNGGFYFLRFATAGADRPFQLIRLEIRPKPPCCVKIGRRIGRRGQVRRQLEVPRTEPRRLHGGRGDLEPDQKRMHVARVAVHRQIQLRRAR